MRHILRSRAGAVCLALAVTAGVAAAAFLPHAGAAAVPTRAAVQSGVTVNSNGKAAVDVSNLSEGFVMVKYTGGRQVRINVQISKS